ncbi:MAG: DNA-processing protein DprA [Candidatus Moranbacteria bacterium]|nr:DNA-processing protein DprA [Candidatus Moranbacteria bacterium]
MTPFHYLHAINTIPQIGSKALRKLLDYFDTPKEIWTASPAMLRASGLTDKQLQAFIDKRPSIDIQAEWKKLTASGITLITQEDIDYPTLLKEIHDPPFLLYKRGAFDWNSKPLITIVGSRNCSAYGERVTEVFASELSAAGIGVASGLAFGIDNAAHKGTLAASGNTVAVLGNSLDDASIAPKSQLPLAHSILNQGGALLSEYPPVTCATPYTFPARNRILAGMSQGVLVVEAAQKSGSLITARFALEFNREVFAVPGSIFSEASIGPHILLRSGAKIATCLQDILEELGPLTKAVPHSSPAPKALSLDEETVFSLLSSEPLHIDKILKTTTLETSQVQSALVFLEVKGLIKNMGGMHYIRL